MTVHHAKVLPQPLQFSSGKVGTIWGRFLAHKPPKETTMFDHFGTLVNVAHVEHQWLINCRSKRESWPEKMIPSVFLLILIGEA